MDALSVRPTISPTGNDVLWDVLLLKLRAGVLRVEPLRPLGSAARGIDCWFVPLVELAVPAFSLSCKLCFPIIWVDVIGGMESVSLSFLFFLFDFDLFLLESMRF